MILAILLLSVLCVSIILSDDYLQKKHRSKMTGWDEDLILEMEKKEQNRP